MFRPLTVSPGRVLPARSAASPLMTLCAAPLLLTSLSLGQLAMPDRLSSQVNATRTSLCYQPSALGVVVGAPVITGAVRSMLIPPSSADALLPALSETLTGPAPRLTPSPWMTVSSGRVAGSMPARASSAVQWTVTSPWYQPAAFGALVVAPIRFGLVRSMLMSLTTVVDALPALSTASPWTSWPASSLSTVRPGEQLARPDSASEQANVTVTGVLF